MTIIAATDFSETSVDAVICAHALAKERNQPLVVVHAVAALDRGDSWRVLYEAPDEIMLHVRQQAETLTHRMLADRLGPSAPTEIDTRIVFGDAADHILEVADELDADLIVVGASGDARWKAAILGTTASHVVRNASVPVLVVHRGARLTEIRRVVVPVDLGAESEVVLAAGGDFARSVGARLVVLHAAVLPQFSDLYAPPLVYDPVSADAFVERREALLAKLVEESDYADLVDIAEVRREGPAGAIEASMVEHGASVVCIGTHGRKGVERLFLGSTTERILRGNVGSVLTIRPDA